MNIQIEQCRVSNDSTLRMNGYYIHSKYDPKLEADRIVEANYKSNNLFILFGIGYGYIVESFLEKITNMDSLIIIEPNLEIVNIERVSTLITNIEERDNVYFIDKNHIDDELKSTLNSSLAYYTADKIQVVMTPNYEKLYTSEIKNCMDIINNTISSFYLNKNTSIYFKELWQENLYYNLFYSKEVSSLQSLNKKMDGPVVIASGGPSLVEQIPILKKFREQVYLLAAGSTINTLLRNDIVPDGVISIDGSELNYNHFKGLDCSDVTLFFDTRNHYLISKNHKGLKVMFNNFVVDKRVRDLVNNILPVGLPCLRGGVSVATYALELAKYITSGPICIIGQDLSYSNGFSHATGNKGLYKITEDDIQKKGIYSTKDMFGQVVYTDISFNAMKEVFENLLEYYNTAGINDNIIYNCTSKGLAISNLEHMDFDEFVRKYCQMNLLAQKEEMNKEIEFNSFKNNDEVIRRFIFESEILKEVRKLSNEALNITRKCKVERFKSSYLSKLDKLDKRIRELLNQTLLNDIFNSLVYEVMEKTREISEQAVYDNSVLLYEGIIEATKFFDKFLRELR